MLEYISVSEAAKKWGISERRVQKTTIENIWETVTSLTNYSWRSDITKIEIINDIQFREYSKTGFATTFTVTVLKKATVNLCAGFRKGISK